MNYSEFLFGQLLIANVESAKNVAYDELFPLIKTLYKCFEESDENIDVRSEYDCIERYIRNNETFLIESLKEAE